MLNKRKKKKKNWFKSEDTADASNLHADGVVFLSPLNEQDQ
jgi:hypothetical protein